MFTKAEFLFNGIIALAYFSSRLPFCFIRTFKEEKPQYDFDNCKGKIAIITGANTGVGRATAIQLTALGVHVVIASRDAKKSADAVEDIKLSATKLAKMYDQVGTIEYIPLDLSNVESVHRFVNLFKSKYVRLDILVNNAGLNIEGTTTDGLQQLFQINYLGHFLLFRLLMNWRNSVPASERGSLPPLRVVNLSSVMHHLGQSDFTKSAFSKLSGNSFSYYDDSKFYMNLMVLEINRRYSQLLYSDNTCRDDHRDVLAVSVNPGAVRSDIWRHVPSSILWLYDIVMRLLYLSVDQGCSTSVFAALASNTTIQQATSLYSSFPSLISENGNKICTPDFDNLLRQADAGGKFCGHPLIPYVVPYAIPKLDLAMGAWRWRYRVLGCEMLGVYAGPQFSEVSLPAETSALAQSLWEFSSSLCVQKLQERKIAVEFID